MVATLSLQGQGLYPLSPQGRQALLNSVNQTLAAQGTTVTNITLGQVNVSAFLTNVLCPASLHFLLMCFVKPLCWAD